MSQVDLKNFRKFAEGKFKKKGAALDKSIIEYQPNTKRNTVDGIINDSKIEILKDELSKQNQTGG